MPTRLLLPSALASGVLILAGLAGAPGKAHGAQQWSPVEDFSLYGFVADEMAQLTENVVALGIAQASFQNDLVAARRALKEGWNSPAERDRAAGRLAGLLFQKDLMYALLPIGEGVARGWERSQALHRLAGTPLDGGIPSYATGAFLHWVQTVRAHLGVYGDDELASPVAMSNWKTIANAIEKSNSAYQLYAVHRDSEELRRFLPVPPSRLAADGSGALKEQVVDGFSATGWGVDQKQPLAARLRALAQQKQPMLVCLYGPTQVASDGQSHSVYRQYLFWYKAPPANIKALMDLDDSPTRSGYLGAFAGLGSAAFERCPGSEKSARAVQVANVATHPATLKQQATREAQGERIRSKCGGDAACERQEMRRGGG